MHTRLQMLDIPGSYFELPEDSIAGDESLEEMCYAERLEASHTAYHISLYDWKRLGNRKGLINVP